MDILWCLTHDASVQREMYIEADWTPQCYAVGDLGSDDVCQIVEAMLSVSVNDAGYDS